MNLIGYCRVSTESQEDNTSLTEQVRKIETYCSAHGHFLQKTYIEVGSGSSTAKRPQFLAAIDNLSIADGLICTKLDRLARNTKELLITVDDYFQSSGKALIILDMNIDTSTLMGRLFLEIVAAIGSFERGQINERTQGGRRAKADKGGYAYGAPKYGYRSVDGVLIENPVEQGNLLLIKHHRRSGKSYTAIAAWLNMKEIPSPQGKRWSMTTIQRILEN
jgi:DNA invertase Pin-like site-specific DNA recombinase